MKNSVTLSSTKGDVPWFVGLTMTPLLAVFLLSACGTVEDQANRVRGDIEETVSGALQPVRAAVGEVERRIDQAAEGVNDLGNGISKLKGAFSGSGATW